jgi:hypothetical protein
MYIDRHTGLVGKFQTKQQRIAELEAALLTIQSGALNLDQCIDLARSLRRTDRRWSKPSPRRFELVNQLQRLGY